jgi:hypothetical protein
MAQAEKIATLEIDLAVIKPQVADHEKILHGNGIPGGMVKEFGLLQQSVNDHHATQQEHEKENRAFNNQLKLAFLVFALTNVGLIVTEILKH